MHRDREPVETVFEDPQILEGADRVVHAASHVGPAGILQYTGRLGPDMIRAAESVIERCIQADVPLCMFSSAEIYGRSGSPRTTTSASLSHTTRGSNTR